MAKPIEAVYMAFGARIRIIREALGMTQFEVGERLKITRTSVNNIEAGRQRILLHDVDKFAQALGTTSKNLLKGIWW